jgi:hypothetical protein
LTPSKASAPSAPLGAQLEVRLPDGTVMRGGRVAEVVALARAEELSDARVSSRDPELRGGATGGHAQILSTGCGARSVSGSRRIRKAARCLRLSIVSARA